MSLSFPESILVTGGAGFVGSSLAFHLKARHPRTRVVCLDNLYRRGSELNVPRFQEAGVEFVKGDIRYAKEFPPGPFEFILECSAEPSVLAGYGESPDYLMETNFLGTYRCLEQARRWKSKFLFLLHQPGLSPANSGTASVDGATDAFCVDRCARRGDFLARRPRRLSDDRFAFALRPDQIRQRRFD